MYVVLHIKLFYRSNDLYLARRHDFINFPLFLSAMVLYIVYKEYITSYEFSLFYVVSMTLGFYPILSPRLFICCLVAFFFLSWWPIYLSYSSCFSPRNIWIMFGLFFSYYILCCHSVTPIIAAGQPWLIWSIIMLLCRNSANISACCQ